MWYQKEFLKGQLYEAFLDVTAVLRNGVFSCDEERLTAQERSCDDGIFFLVLQRLCRVAALSLSARSKLTIETDKFLWKQGEGGEDEYCYCSCRKTPYGWLLKVGGNLIDLNAAVNRFGWRKLSHNHPFANIDVVAVGPSHHVNLCRND